MHISKILLTTMGMQDLFIVPGEGVGERSHLKMRDPGNKVGNPVR